jgi:ketosteroid isomerase-like protein
MANSKEVEREITRLETEYWQALKDNDLKAALQLTADPCIVTGAQGVASLDHETFAKLMDDASWTLEDFTLSEMQVRKIDQNVAVAAYKVHEELTVDGKPLKLDAAESSTWVRRNGRWLCVVHTESLSGDPFGRDRATAH